MGEFSGFKKNLSKLEKEKLEQQAKQNEAYKPKVQQKTNENTTSSTFMSDAKPRYSKLQLEKMASKAKEGTQSANQKTQIQPRNTSKSPVPVQVAQRKVVTPNPIPSRNKTNANGTNAPNPLKRKFDALKPQNAAAPTPKEQAGHELKKVKITEDRLNISVFSSFLIS